MKRTDDAVSLRIMLAEPGWDRGQTATLPPGSAGPPGTAPRSSLRRRRRSDRPLLGILALAIGVIWLLEVATIHISGETVLSVLLMLLGLGMVVTGRRGGRVWPVLLGVLLTIALVAGSTSFHVDIPTNGGFGNRVYRPSSPGQLQSLYELTAGNVTLDLSSLGTTSLSGQTVTIRQGFGKITIALPNNTMPVNVQARLNFGSFQSPSGPTRGGVAVNQGYTQGPPQQALQINVKVFAGSVAVTTGPPPSGQKFPFPATTVPPVPSTPPGPAGP